MKRKLSIVLSLVAGVAIVSLAADLSGGKPKTDQGQDAILELRAQIAELRLKIQSLETQTKTLESKVEQLKQSPAPVPLNLYQGSPAVSPTVPGPASSRPPTIWGQGEVNGWTFYYVPCGERSR